MNIIEAIKSKKPFKRQGWPQRGWAHWVHESWIPEVSIADLIADDWEIQEPMVTITRTQFWNAVNEESLGRCGDELLLRASGIEHVARKLGLEP